MFNVRFRPGSGEGQICEDEDEYDYEYGLRRDPQQVELRNEGWKPGAVLV